MKSRHRKRLERLSAVLLDPRRPAWQLRPEVLELVELLQALSGRSDDLTSGIDRGETVTPNGVALSPTMAVLCAADYARTVAFARGLHAAVRDVLERVADRQVRVLYAGCGPYALLTLPALAVLPVGSLSVTLLDLSEESLRSARQAYEALGLDGHVAGYVAGDAASHQIAAPRHPDRQTPSDVKPDVVLLEVMQARLEKEPQVALTRHLLRQAPDAILVPQSVAVDAELVDPGREFVFPVDATDGTEPERRRVPLGRVFELSKESVESWVESGDDRLPAGSIRFPDPLPSGCDPMLCTRLVVYGEHRLEDYDSGITMPLPLPIGRPFLGGERIDFHYRLGSRPGLRCRHSGS